jgi:hypothetical protein
VWKVRKSLRALAAAARGITRTRIGVPGRKTSRRWTKSSARRRAMSQEQFDAAEKPPGEPGGGMFRPGRTQRETLLMVLRLSAGYEQWVTLAELAGKTKFPPASISAQLRHLRKAEYGGWAVEKRRREWVEEELVWEYRLAGGGGSGIEGGKGSKGKASGGGDECKTGDGV